MSDATSVHRDLAGPEPLDLIKLLREHDELHTRMAVAFRPATFKQVNDDIDTSLQRIGERLTPGGVAALLHLVAELVADALNPRRPHHLHFDHEQLAYAVAQMTYLMDKFRAVVTEGADGS